jgi:hypothetical protein
MRTVSVAAALVGLALTACGATEPAGSALPAPSDVSTASSSIAPPTTTATDAGGSNGPFDPDATIRDDLMVVESSVVANGQEVLVTYPGGRERGVAYVLEKLIDTTWYATHFMTATTSGYGTEPTWAEVGTEGYGWEDIGIAGEGPDRLIVPDSALAGRYRVCTANSVENICAELTVVKSDDSPAPGPDPDPPFVGGTTAPVSEFIGESVAVFEELVASIGLGPVRVAWRDGESVPVEEDLLPGRVNIAVEEHDGIEFVIDARVEADTETGWVEPEPTIVDVYGGVEFYPACGNEQLEHDGVVWYSVQEFEYPDVYERVVDGDREQAPESVTVHGIAPRVAAPGPGDDVGTLVVWSDGVAYFVSDSGDLHAWLVQEELTYNWEC